MQPKQRPRQMYPKIGTLDFGAIKKIPTVVPRQLPIVGSRPSTKAEKRIADMIVNDMLNDVRKLNSPSRINKYGTKEMEEIIGQLRRMELNKMKNKEKQPILPLCPSPKKPKSPSPKKVVKNFNNMTLAELRRMYAAEANALKAVKKKSVKVAKLREKVKKDMKKLRAINEPNMKVDRSRALGQLKAKARKQMKVLKPENAHPQFIKVVQKNIKEANEHIELIKQILQKNKNVIKELKRPLRRGQTPSPGSVRSMGSSVGSGRSSRSASPVGSMYSVGSRASVHSTPGRSPGSPVGLFPKKSPGNAMEMIRVDDPKMYLKKLGYNNTRIARKSKKVENPYRTENLMKIADVLKIKTGKKVTNTELRKKIRAKID
jgi:ferritin-like metal-binding protein YciE